MKRLTVRAWREHRGLTQEALAARSGLRQGVISTIETGRIKNPGVDVASKLARALHVSIEQIIFAHEFQEATR